jgi:pantetheine-phosphate adenylyltransferase
MHTRGVVAGSFDPITRGHERLICEAARLVDELDVVLGVNPTKKYTFDDATRERLLRASLADLDLAGTVVNVHLLASGLLVKFAARVGATHLIRGIRNLHDFAYETDMAQVNAKLQPAISTVYLVSPPELVQVSSSTVKTLASSGEGWEAAIRDYVHPAVIEAFKAKFAQGQE